MNMMDPHMSPMPPHMGMHTPNSVPPPPSAMTQMGPQGPAPMGLSPVSCGPPTMLHSNTPPGHPQMAGQGGAPLMSMAPGPGPGYHHPAVSSHHLMPHGQGPGPGQYHMVPSGPPPVAPAGHPGAMPAAHPVPHPGPHPGPHPPAHPGPHPPAHPGPHPPAHPGPHHGPMHGIYGPGAAQAGPPPPPPPPHPGARMAHVDYPAHQRCLPPAGPPPAPPGPPPGALMPMNSGPPQGGQQPPPPPVPGPPHMAPMSAPAPPPPPFACAKCKETLSEVEQPVQCEAYCRQFYHRYCSGLTAEAIYLLQSEPYIEWLCTGCERTLGPSGIPWVKRGVPY